jgi:TatD DNase family protein
MVAALPLESLVLETDSPYLPPQERRGGRNEPAFLPATMEAVARIKGLSPSDVAAATTRNAERLYGIGVKGLN